MTRHLHRTLAAAALSALLLIPAMVRAEPAQGAAFEPGPGGWRTQTVTSAFDRKHQFAALLDANIEVPNSIGRMVKPALVLRCSSGQGLESYITWSLFLGSGRMDVSLRFDEEPVQTVNWLISDDGEANGLFGARANGAFLARLSTAHKLAVRSSRYNATPVETVFDLTGTGEVVAEAQKACA